MNDGKSFELDCAEALRTDGWSVGTTPSTGDQGADLLAILDGVSVAIQCKNLARPVGNSAVQEAYSSGSFYQANFSAVVSNSAFTPAAKNLAVRNGVILLQRNQIKALKHLVGAKANNISASCLGVNDTSLQEAQIQIDVTTEAQAELFGAARNAIDQLEFEPLLGAQLFLNNLEEETGLGSGYIDVSSLIWLLKAADTFLSTVVEKTENTLNVIRSSDDLSVRSHEFSDDDVFVWQILGSDAKLIQKALWNYFQHRSIQNFLLTVGSKVSPKFVFAHQSL